MTEVDQSLPFCADATTVMRPLRQLLTELVHRAPAGEGSREPLLRQLNATLQSRLSRALEAEDDFSALYYMPGPEGLRRVADAAERVDQHPERLERLHDCIDAYEQFLETEGIDRERLHALLGGFFPKARETMVRNNGQAVFKAMSNIMGYYAQTMLTCIVVLPGENPNRCTLALLRGFYGWRRLRQETWTIVTGTEAGLTDADLRMTTLDGVELSKLTGPPLISQYCRNPPTFELSKIHGQTRHYTMADIEIGARSECDFFMGEVYWNADQRYADEHRDMSIGFASIATPSKHLLFDMLIHQDVWSSAAPLLECYRLVPQGIVTEANWHARQGDRLELGVRHRTLAQGLPNISTPALPTYPQIVDHVLDKLDAHADHFVGYRCTTRYPLYGSQYCMRFNLPASPG